jgi:hypothetical protein
MTSKIMNEASITQYITGTFAGVETAASGGCTFFFYGTERKLPFATLATEDNDYDRSSNLSRPDVFRLNVGVSKDTYRSLFGPPPSPGGATGVVDAGHDFTTSDEIMPHPVYAPQSWVCVLNPSAVTFQIVQRLLAEAYDIAVAMHAKREARRATTEDPLSA